MNDTSTNSERLLQAFRQTSAIGFAIVDDQLRYQAINQCLASINGMAAEVHLGVTVRELFGELSETIAEPCYRSVLAHGEMSRFEITNARLPMRPDSRFWGLNTNFPIRDRAGRVRQIGIMVVEVTEQRKLEKFLHKLAGELRRAKTQETLWFERELQDSIDQYHAALATSLDLLIRDREKSTELLTQSVEGLDQRITTMRTLLSSVANGWLSDHK